MEPVDILLVVVVPYFGHIQLEADQSSEVVVGVAYLVNIRLEVGHNSDFVVVLTVEGFDLVVVEEIGLVVVERIESIGKVVVGLAEQIDWEQNSYLGLAVADSN